jgi:hypothetical protein
LRIGIIIYYLSYFPGRFFGRIMIVGLPEIKMFF